MTHLFMTSVITSPASAGRNKKGSNRSVELNSYQVEVIDFDGDSYDYAVEAESFKEASEKAESLCCHDNIQINYMNIYKC